MITIQKQFDDGICVKKLTPEEWEKNGPTLIELGWEIVK